MMACFEQRLRRGGESKLQLGQQTLSLLLHLYKTEDTAILRMNEKRFRPKRIVDRLPLRNYRGVGRVY